MDVTPRELRDVEIREAFRGYNRDEVNDLLERAAAAIEALNERTRVLGERLASGQTESGRGRDTEDMLHRTLLLAQRASDEAIAEADTLLLTVPNTLGVDYNVHVIESILTHVAPALGWR